MATVEALTAYLPIPDAIWWISDYKPRSELAPEEITEERRRAKESYRRMRERMAADPAYREKRLAVGRRVAKDSRARNRGKAKARARAGERTKPRSEMTPEALAERRRRDRETYMRMKRRMRADPAYREARLEVARRAMKNWRDRSRDNSDVIGKKRARDRARWRAKGSELNGRKRKAYVGTRAEEIREANREWYAANREERQRYNRAFRVANGDAIRARDRERQRQEYAQDPKKFSDYNKAWRAQNPEKARAYVRVSQNKRRAVTTETHFTVKEWLALVRAYAGRCGYCGMEGPLEADHRAPLCRGGSNTIDNIIPACRHCNRRKHRKTESEFRALLAEEAARRATGPGKETRPGPGESESVE